MAAGPAAPPPLHTCQLSLPEPLSARNHFPRTAWRPPGAPATCNLLPGKPSSSLFFPEAATSA